MNISELSIRRPTLVVVLFTILTFLGYISLKSLNYELIPKFSTPYFSVVTVYPGASPSEVENSLTKPIEEAVSGLPNVETIRSISQEGVAMVIVELKLKADVDAVLNEAVRKIKSVQGDFPKSALEPSVSKISVDDSPVISLGVRANLPASELYDELNYRVKPAFAKIDGVGEVSLVSGTEREIQVNIDHDKLDNYKLSILQVLQTVQSSNMDFPAGKITTEQRQTLLRMSAKYKTPDDIRNLVVARMPDGTLVKLHDIAEVIDTEKDMTSIFRVNGEQSVGIQIKKQDDANTVQVCQAVKEEVQQLEKQYAAQNIQFSIPQDSSLFILEAARSVTKDLLVAIVLVTLIMVLFLHSIRNAVIVMIAVPLSLIASFIGMELMGYSLNLMTLLALSLVIGTLVDDAIVVLENIYRHLEMGKTRWQATLDGIKEIGLSVMSITLVLVVVFFPVALSESIIAPIINPFAMVIVIVIILSLLVAFTAVPLLTSRFSKLEQLNRTSPWGKFISGFEKTIDRFGQFIQGILVWALRHKAATLVMAIILFIASLGLLGGGFIGSEFISVGDMGECILTIEYPKDYTIQQNNLVTRRIEKAISNKKEVTDMYTSVGSSSGMLTVQGGNYKSEINIKLVDKDKRNISSNRFVKNLERELNASFPGVKVRSAVVSMLGGSDENPIQIVFRGTDTDTLFAFAEKMKNEIARIPGTNNVKLSIEGGSPEVVIKVDKDRMNQLGLSLDIVGMTIQTAFNGNTDSKFQVGDYEYDINVRLDAFNRQSVSDVENLTCINVYGEPVKLKQFCDVSEETGTSKLERYARMSSITIEAQALGRAVGDIGTDLETLLNKTVFPSGVNYVMEGDLKFQGDAFGSLGLALVISIFLVYLIMVALYESYLHPFVVLFSIPLSVIGALLALALARQNLSIFSMLGLIMLVGLVTKNAILVVDFTNTLRKEGNSLLKSLITSVRLRLRPILMTAISTVVGMLPIALSHGAGAEWKSGLGWVLIGGMTSSMLLTLIVVPVVYLVAEQVKIRIKRFWKKNLPKLQLSPEKL
jgi:HAE1 family hydrophobic/amphiphilic exporter-1